MVTLNLEAPWRRRRDLAQEIARHLDGYLRIIDPRDGWPALAEIFWEGNWFPVSLHVGPVVLSGRDRDEIERRVQNPGETKPVIELLGARPLILGIWDWERPGTGDQPVFVAFDRLHHVGVEGRLSLWIPLRVLEIALSTGWAQGQNSAGELLTAFWRTMMPAYVDIFANGDPVDVSDIVNALEVPADPRDARPIERIRRTVSRVIRDKRFGREVRQAYGGLCAVCGLNFGLVEGAHVLPVEAAGDDHLTNGVALCGNHHAAFDAHRLWIHPRSRELLWHPQISGAAAVPLTHSARRTLADPRDPSARPTEASFEKRYEFFDDAYRWLAKRRPVTRGISH